MDWNLIVEAFELLGYEFQHPQEFLHLPLDTQLKMWEEFRLMYQKCSLECAWKGGGPCLHEGCPRRVLRRVRL